MYVRIMKEDFIVKSKFFFFFYKRSVNKNEKNQIRISN